VANPQHVRALTGSPCGGLFYASSGGGVQLALQLAGAGVVLACAGSAAYALFWALDRKGWLRVDQVSELAGIDDMEHGGPAYPEAAGAHHVGFCSSGGDAAGSRRIMV
jgi:Amt family ammonium transporter